MHYDIRDARAEIDALKHDIERHIAICTEQANRISELEKALREAMEWNWLDEDMNQGVANACERVLNGGTF
jgi:hypothetical protein